MFNKIIKNFIDALFPVFCVKCGKEGEWWCGDCLVKENFVGIYGCPVCAKVGDGRPCVLCARQSFLNGITAVFSYQENNSAATLIKNLKYRLAENAAEVFPLIWDKFLVDKDFSLLNGAVLVPVPLHKKRFNERGFNQAFLIANSLAVALKKAGIATVVDDNCLKRHRYTMPQARLNKEERKNSIGGAFTCLYEKAPEKILLVDDVFTTGATMQECAKILKKHGAKYVWGFALARD